MLTQKQEAFCLAYFETGNASEAYRRSYSAENMRPETVNRKAKGLLDKGKIGARLEQLRAEAAERSQLTVEDLLRELEEARKTAMDKSQASAAVSAIMGKAKLLGFDVHKVEHSGKDGGPIEYGYVLTPEQAGSIEEWETLVKQDQQRLDGKLH